MKIVLTTQDRENYAAHNGFDGEYRWKFKGGDTYIIEGVTVEQAQDPAFWSRVEESVTHRDDYFESYVIGADLVDEGEDISKFHESWESPIFLTLLECGRVQATRVEVNNDYNFRAEIAEKRSRWFIENSLVVESTYTCEYLKTDGTVVDWEGSIVETPTLFAEAA